MSMLKENGMSASSEPLSSYCMSRTCARNISITDNIPSQTSGVNGVNNIGFDEEKKLNNLSANNALSDDDNTMERSSKGKSKNRRGKLKRQSTLSIVEKDLEALRMKIHRKVDDMNSSVYSAPIKIWKSKRVHKTNRISSTTRTKQPDIKKTKTYNANEDSSGESETEIYSDNINYGDNKFMLICEPKETKSRVINNKQIGNNNVIVNLNLNISSNACQIIDKYGEVIKLDTGGEVWLEIKRRRHHLKSPTQATPKPQKQPCESSCSDNNCSCSSDRRDWTNSHTYDSPKDATDTSANFNNRVTNLSYDKKISSSHSRSPDEHLDSERDHDINVNEDDQIYDTVKKIDDDTISLKFETLLGMNGERCFDETCLTDDVLKRQGVVDFMQNNGTDFDIAICEWEYEHESVYSYVTEKGDTKQGGYPYAVVRSHGPAILPREPTEHSCDHHSRPPSPSYSSVNELSKIQITGGVSPSPPPRNPDVTYRRKPRPDEPPGKRYDVRLPSPPRQNTHPEIQAPDYVAPPVPVDVSVDYDSGRLVCEDKTKKDTLNGYAWYYGKCSAKEAETCLKGKSHGSFLVRDSSEPKPEHLYTMVFNDEGTIRRLKILQKDNMFFFSDSTNKTFDTVEDLIAELQKTNLEIKLEKGIWKRIKVQQLPPS